MNSGKSFTYVEEYMKFGEYENSEQLLQPLQQYTFEKNYDNNTVDLELEALSKICMHRIFIFENSIDSYWRKIYYMYKFH